MDTASAGTTVQTTNIFDFLGFPLEVRQKIYEYYYQHPKHICWSAVKPGRFCFSPLRPRPLSLVCEGIRNEIRSHGPECQLRRNVILIESLEDFWQDIQTYSDRHINLLQNLNIRSFGPYMTQRVLTHDPTVDSSLASLALLPRLKHFTLWLGEQRESHEWWMDKPVEDRDREYASKLQYVAKRMPVLSSSVQMELFFLVVAPFWFEGTYPVQRTGLVTVRMACALDDAGRWKQSNVKERWQCLRFLDPSQGDASVLPRGEQTRWY